MSNRYARLGDDGRVVEIISPAGDIAEFFSPAFVAKLQDVTALPDVDVGWLWDGSTFSAPAEPEEPSPEEVWAGVRGHRDRLLTASDWTQVADAPLDEATKDLWRTYRQALRDVPETFPNPDSVIWPAPPGE